MISVIAACPQSFFQKDSRQAGMTYNVTLLMNSLVSDTVALLYGKFTEYFQLRFLGFSCGILLSLTNRLFPSRYYSGCFSHSDLFGILLLIFFQLLMKKDSRQAGMTKPCPCYGNILSSYAYLLPGASEKKIVL
jgi:hypothetical protein